MRGENHSTIILRSRRPDSQRRRISKQGLVPAEAQGVDQASRGLIVVESEGAVFDVPGIRVEQAYIPAFIEHFGYSADPALCAEIWRFIALRSRLRGTGAFRCLAAGLRLVNRRCSPSVRRSVVAATLEAWLSNSGDQALRSELAFRTDPVLRPAWEWYRTAEALIALLPPPEAFPSAVDALTLLAESCTILALSSEAETAAISIWTQAGLASLCSRVAGRERGDMAVYLARACAAGNESASITVVGSNYSSLSAARSVEARFLPIIPGREDECWKNIIHGGASLEALLGDEGQERGGAASPEARGAWRKCIPAMDLSGLLFGFLESSGSFPLR